MTRSDPDLGSQTGSYTFQLQCKWWGVGRGRIFFLLPFTDTVLWALVWFWDVSTFKGMKLWLLHPPLNLYGFIVQLLMEFLILSQGSKEIHVQNIPDSILFYGCYVCGLSLRCKKKKRNNPIQLVLCQSSMVTDKWWARNYYWAVKATFNDRDKHLPGGDVLWQTVKEL